MPNDMIAIDLDNLFIDLLFSFITNINSRFLGVLYGILFKDI